VTKLGQGELEIIKYVKPVFDLKKLNQTYPEQDYFKNKKELEQ
jgi:hypothetical protein